MTEERSTFDVIFDLSSESIKNAIEHLPSDEAFAKVMDIVGDLLVEQEKQISRETYGI